MAQIDKPGLVARTRDFFLRTLKGDFDDTMKFQRRLQGIIKFSIATVTKFLDDEVLLRAASISYAVVVSFVPTLVVIMMLGARFINIEEYFRQMDDMARLSGLQMDLQPYFNIIRDLLKNAGAIGGIGLLVLMFSATSVLRNVEDSVNKIWRVSRRRPLVQKIAGFIMVLIFGPILLTVGISSAQWVVQQFAAPHINQVKVVRDTVQILGDQHLFLVQSEKGKPFREKNILKQTDFNADNAAFVYDTGTNRVVSAERSDVSDQAPVASRKELRDAVFSDYARVGSREFIITQNGILAVSKDNGETYHLRKFYHERGDIVQTAGLNRIQFFTDRKGVIVGDAGLFLHTSDAGETWQFAGQTNVTKRLREIAMVRPGTWIILGEENTVLITEDDGDTFKPYAELLKAVGDRRANFTGLALSDRAGYVVGEAGLLLVTRDRGFTWKSMNMAQSMFFEDVAVSPDGVAVAVGYDGLIRYSEFLSDGSIQWVEGKSTRDVNLHAVRYYAKENRFIIGGDHYQMLTHQMTAENAGQPRDFTVIQSAPFWRRLISATGNVLIPFFVIFLLFFLLYKVIPYTEVSAKAASVGAAFTSVSWVIFLVAYKFYVTNFSKGTAALYGTLALVPLTLLLVYVSALIVLFGAELAFFAQYPQLFRMDKKTGLDERHKRQLWYGLGILQRLALSFNAGKVDQTTDKLTQYCNGDQEEFGYIIERLKERGYVTQTDDQHWVLAMNADLIEISSLVEDLDPSDYSIPEFNGKNAYMRSVKGYFDQLEASRGKVFRKVTLAGLMQQK